MCDKTTKYKTHSTNDSLKKKLHKETSEHYTCRCGTFFISEKLYEEHTATCSDCSTAIYPLQASSTGKLDNADIMKMEGPACSSSCKMISDNEMLITLRHNGSDTPIETGHLSIIETIENQNNMDSSSDSFEIEYKQHTFSETTQNCNNVNAEVRDVQLEKPDGVPRISPVKISTLLSSNNITKECPAIDETQDETSGNSITIERINSTDVENGGNVKTLTILQNIRLDDVSYSKEVNVPNFEVVNGSTETKSTDVVEEIIYLQVCKDDGQMDLESNQNECNNIGQQNDSSRPLKTPKPKHNFTSKIKNKLGQKMWKAKHKPKTCRAPAPTRIKRRKKGVKTVHKSTQQRVQIDLEKRTTPLSENVKQNPTLQTYVHKKKRDNNKDHQKMYQKIPLPRREDEVEQPNQLSVFDFYDEEDAKREIEEKEKEEEMQLLKERTCVHCKEVFKDPIDVLRHKREFHTPRKIRLPQAEIEPYLELENRTHCPLCFKEICRNGYRSVYSKHIMTHCEMRSFSCKVCGVKFRRLDHMQNHEKRHVVCLLEDVN